VLFISLIGLLMKPSLVWAYQRVIAPPAPASPSAAVTVTTIPYSNSVSTGYEITGIQNSVTGVPSGNFLVSELIVSSQKQNGDLPDTLAKPYIATQYMAFRAVCKVGGSETVSGTPTMNGTPVEGDGSYTINPCPANVTGTLDWNPAVPGPDFRAAIPDGGSGGGKWIQAKLFALPQYPDPALQTEPDWLQFRIGESLVMYLPALQGTPGARA
jgi:hypothetical protein